MNKHPTENSDSSELLKSGRCLKVQHWNCFIRLPLLAIFGNVGTTKKTPVKMPSSDTITSRFPSKNAFLMI